MSLSDEIRAKVGGYLLSPKATARRIAYRRWYAMIHRCSDPSHPAWKNYGGRDIDVCPEWRASFTAYYAHVGDAPPGMSLDRIDNDGDYEPSNVQWATPKQQTENRRYDAHSIRTHCPAGHPYDEANTYHDVRRGKRECRTCGRERARLYRRRARERAA